MPRYVLYNKRRKRGTDCEGRSLQRPLFSMDKGDLARYKRRIACHVYHTER
jgi:hypothetical protein